MIIFIVGVLLIVYSIVAKEKYSLAIGMIAVLLIMGFQEGIPGDYTGYKATFEVAGQGRGVRDAEFSYIWMLRIFPKVMSFHAFVFFSSLLQCLAMGYLIKKYATKRYQYFGVLVLFFTFNIMLLQMKALRQAFAIDALVFAYLLLDKKKYILALLTAIVAIGYHNSSMIAVAFFLILFLLKLLKKKEYENKGITGKRTAFFIPMVIVGALLAIYMIRYTFFSSYIEPFLMTNEVFYYDYYLLQQLDDGSRFVPWWQMIYYIVTTYAIAYYFCIEGVLFKKYLAILVIIGFFIAVFVNGYGNLQRISAYFIVFSIFVLPNTAEVIHKKYGRIGAVIFIVFNMLALMRTTVPMMFSDDAIFGTGFVTYTFSFLV